MIIDAHHHLLDEPGYAEKLAEECRRLKIDKICLMALEPRCKDSSNKEVLKAIKKYPDLMIGFAYLDLVNDKPKTINKYKEEGFKGLKIIRTPSNYDDKTFYPFYERAQELGMPILFHLGIVARREDDYLYDINNNRMRPIYLDTIARRFPSLQIIGAHLGNPWYEEATMACRWNPNLYFDLSGSTLKKKSPSFLKELLWWTPTTRYRDPEGRYAWEKIVFGSDVPYNEIEDVMNDYRKVMETLKIDKEIQRKVFGETIAKILGI